MREAVMVRPGFDPALPQMNQMTARLGLAGAAQIISIDGDAADRTDAIDHDVIVEQRLILSRERVERSMELVWRDDDWRRRAVPMPGFGQTAQRRQIIWTDGSCKGHRGVRAGGHQRDVAIAKHPSEVGRAALKRALHGRFE